MLVDLDDLDYAVREMERTDTLAMFGGREWENFIICDQYKALWMDIILCVGGSRPQNGTGKDHNTCVRKILTLVFGTVFSANGKLLPGIGQKEFDTVSRVYEIKSGKTKISEIIPLTLNAITRVANPHLREQFESHLSAAPISNGIKFKICFLVLVLMYAQSVMEGAQAEKEDAIEEIDAKELGLEFMVEPDKPKNPTIELKEPGADGPGGQKRETRSIKAEESEVTFDDVAGYRDVKEKLQRIAQMFMQVEAYRSCGCEPPRGLLLEGPPGVGKTHIIKALANSLKKPFFRLNIAQISSHYVNLTAQYIQQTFDSLRKGGGGILFLDEADSFIFSRKKGSMFPEDQKMLGVLNMNMEPRNPPDNILIVLATNVVESLDEATIREGRIDEIIHMGLPDAQSRSEILTLYINKAQKLAGEKLFENVSASDWGKIIRETKEFSSSGLEILVKRILQVMGDEFTTGKGRRPRTTEDILIQVQEVIIQRKHSGAIHKYGFNVDTAHAPAVPIK